MAAAPAPATPVTPCARCGARVSGVDQWRTCTACQAGGAPARVVDRRGGQQTIVLANAHMSETAVGGASATAERSHVCAGGSCTYVARCRAAEARIATQLVALARRLDALPARTLADAARLAGARDALSLVPDEALALLSPGDRAYVLTLPGRTSEAA